MYLSEKTQKNESLRLKVLQQELSSIEKILRYASFTTGITGATSQIINLLSITLVPTLSSIAFTLKIITPFLSLLTIAQSAYETYKELKNPDMELATLAKILSCLKFAVTALLVTSMLIASVVPGMQVLFIPAALMNTFISVLLSYAKERVIRNTYSKNGLFGYSPSQMDREEFSDHLDPQLTTDALPV